jgi:hypothetical protein
MWSLPLQRVDLLFLRWRASFLTHSEGFDVLTWRKGLAQDIDPDLFTDHTYTDETGRTHAWRVADTTVDLPIGEHDEVFTMRQVIPEGPGPTTRPAGKNTLRLRRGRSTS